MQHATVGSEEGDENGKMRTPIANTLLLRTQDPEHENCVSRSLHKKLKQYPYKQAFALNHGSPSSTSLLYVSFSSVWFVRASERRWQ
jgi:hypothetical protein